MLPILGTLTAMANGNISQSLDAQVQLIVNTYYSSVIGVILRG